ncbi:MAG TPA: hypothetical protein VK994_07330 [Bacteroidales bacterium]|nr:hypothetical protein [Bacteroidales bacterium]
MNRPLDEIARTSLIGAAGFSYVPDSARVVAGRRPQGRYHEPPFNACPSAQYG